MDEETPTVEEDVCHADCYICHPGRPLPWWAFQSHRIKVLNRLAVALGWLEQARSGAPEDAWRQVGNAEQAIRDAYNVVRKKE